MAKQTSNNNLNAEIQCEIFFTIEIKVTEDQNVVLVGSISQLGNWNPYKGMMLTKEEQNRFTTVTPLTLPRKTKFEFKFVVINKDANSIVRWEFLPNNYNRSYKVKHMSVLLYGKEGDQSNESQSDYQHSHSYLTIHSDANVLYKQGYNFQYDSMENIGNDGDKMVMDEGKQNQDESIQLNSPHKSVKRSSSSSSQDSSQDNKINNKLTPTIKNLYRAHCLKQQMGQKEAEIITGSVVSNAQSSLLGKKDSKSYVDSTLSQEGQSQIQQNIFQADITSSDTEYYFKNCKFMPEDSFFIVSKLLPIQLKDIHFSATAESNSKSQITLEFMQQSVTGFDRHLFHNFQQKYRKSVWFGIFLYEEHVPMERKGQLQAQIEEELKSKYNCVPVFVNREEQILFSKMDSFFEPKLNQMNETLIVPQNTNICEQNWSDHLRLTHHFVSKIGQFLRRNEQGRPDAILVVNHQLLKIAEQISQIDITIPIGIFMDQSMHCISYFKQLPYSNEIFDAILQANLLLFSNYDQLKMFLRNLQPLLSIQLKHQNGILYIIYQGRQIFLRAANPSGCYQYIQDICHKIESQAQILQNVQEQSIKLKVGDQTQAQQEQNSNGNHNNCSTTNDQQQKQQATTITTTINNHPWIVLSVDDLPTSYGTHLIQKYELIHAFYQEILLTYTDQNYQLSSSPDSIKMSVNFNDNEMMISADTIKNIKFIQMLLIKSSFIQSDDPLLKKLNQIKAQINDIIQYIQKLQQLPQQSQNQQQMLFEVVELPDHEDSSMEAVINQIQHCKSFLQTSPSNTCTHLYEFLVANQTKRLPLISQFALINKIFKCSQRFNSQCRYSFISSINKVVHSSSINPHRSEMVQSCTIEHWLQSAMQGLKFSKELLQLKGKKLISLENESTCSFVKTVVLKDQHLQHLNIDNLSQRFKKAKNRLIVITFDLLVNYDQIQNFTNTNNIINNGYLRKKYLTPEPDCLDWLKLLALNDVENTLYIVTRKSSDAYLSWFQKLYYLSGFKEIGLVSENGVLFKMHGQKQWDCLQDYQEQSWKEIANKIMEKYVLRQQNSTLINKESTVVLKHENYYNEMIRKQLKGLHNNLNKIFEQIKGVDILLEKDRVSVHPQGIDQAAFIEFLTEQIYHEKGKIDFVLLIDNKPEEQLFKGLNNQIKNNPNFFTENFDKYFICSGLKPTLANYYIQSNFDVKIVLQTLSESQNVELVNKSKESIDSSSLKKNKMNPLDSTVHAEHKYSGEPSINHLLQSNEKQQKNKDVLDESDIINHDEMSQHILDQNLRMFHFENIEHQ